MQDRLDGLLVREARQTSIRGRHTQLQAGAFSQTESRQCSNMPVSVTSNKHDSLC